MQIWVIKLKLFKSHNLILFQLIIVISSCSSLDNLRFWQSDEVDSDEPKKLMTFSDEKTLSVKWKNAYKGENNIGNFIPDFSSQNLFFSDASGQVISLDANTGNENWSTELNFLASGTAAGFGIVVVSDIQGNVIALDLSLIHI